VNDIDVMQMLPFLIPLIILELALLIWALLDVLKREHVRGGNKTVWILVIVLFSIIGPVVYFIFGREENADAGDKV